MSYYGNILEEELKNRVAADWFAAYDTAAIEGKIDFSVAPRQRRRDAQCLLAEKQYLLWGESKKGTNSDIRESFVQLVLTIGRARTYDRHLPPAFLAAFDAEKIAFLPYSDIRDVFYQNDFNWHVTPSDHTTKEFQQLYTMVAQVLAANTYLFYYATDGSDLRAFIRSNLVAGSTRLTAIQINKNNFTHVYNKWLRAVKGTIGVAWDRAKRSGILDADFYLADLLSRDNLTIKDKLFVVLQYDHYRLNRHIDDAGLFAFQQAEFLDGGSAHRQFWNKYERPPREEYWDYIITRRDLLVPQDIRERKGSFFTPQQWVELSQDYIARALGEEWQDHYVVWDCCAGTGNLLAGLTNPYNIYASTIDKADVDVMHDLIANNSLNLRREQVFQFDFLNDSFDQLPQSLRNIIANPQQRQHLIIYINPPYAEATNARTMTRTGENRPLVATDNATYRRYRERMGKASNELFAQFLIRAYKEIDGCIIANFSTLKVLTGPNFNVFRNEFKARLLSLFVMPANTFDNVKGKFPIGFHIWDTAKKEVFEQITADVYDKEGTLTGTKNIYGYVRRQNINNWLSRDNGNNDNNCIGTILYLGNDFQHNMYTYLSIGTSTSHYAFYFINETNLIVGCVYFAVRQCIEATWLNDRDQFLYPADSWRSDTEFQNDCLAYTLFHGQNRISSAAGVNHWLPFTEDEVGASERFDSHFMTDFIRGRRAATAPPQQQEGDLPLDDSSSPAIADAAATSPVATSPSAATAAATVAPAAATSPVAAPPQQPLVFSAEAQAVFAAGRALWQYYHKQRFANPNASFYDIRLHFQGSNDNGRMNNTSSDSDYNRRLAALRQAQAALAAKIARGVYRHAFLLP